MGHRHRQIDHREGLRGGAVVVAILLEVVAVREQVRDVGAGHGHQGEGDEEFLGTENAEH